MNTSKSIVLVGVSFRYFCQTWRATSWGDDLAVRRGVEGLLFCTEGSLRGAGVVAGIEDAGVADLLGVAGCAGFLAIVAGCY